MSHNIDIDDIEDIIKESDPPVQRLPHSDVQPKRKGPRGKADDKPEGANIPGVQSIYVKTWGCSHNTSDGEYMAGQLASYGYTITEDPDVADLWLLNSCTVKNPAQDHFVNEVNKARDHGKHLVVAGCVPQAAPSHKALKGVSIIGVQQIDRVVEVVEETLKGHAVRLLGQKKEGKKRLGGADLDLPKIRKNPFVEIVPISTGCLNQCTYCKTKHARGQLGSYPPEDIVNRIKKVVNEEGVVEIWLSSEDTGAYGRDIGTDLPSLLWKIVEVLPEGTFLRVGMTNPPYILEHLEEMGKILAHPRVYSFLHVPVQAASDKVLQDMRREYTLKDFKQVVDVLREKVPGVNIATDIICGFPTETAEDFKITMDLVREYKFASLFINQFYPRPGTPAAKMQRLPTSEVKQRSRELTHLFEEFRPFKGRVGQRIKVLVTDKAPDGRHYVGKTKAYEQVLVPKDKRVMGKLIEVEVIAESRFEMTATIIEESIDQAPVRPPPINTGLPNGKVIKHASKGGKQINVEYGHGQEEELNEIDDNKLREEEENEKGDNDEENSNEFCENCDCEKPSQKSSNDHSHSHGCGSDDCCQAPPKNTNNNTKTNTSDINSSPQVQKNTTGDIANKISETQQVSRTNSTSAPQTSYVTTTVKLSALALVLAIVVMFYLA